MTVGIVGLGLIGGSFAKAYHAAGHTVLAFDTDRSTYDFAVLSGTVNGPLTDETLSTCDLILIAVLLANVWLGARRGLVGALYGVIGRIGMIAASVAAAKYTAPYIAQWVVVPAVGQLFEKQAALKTAEGVLDGLRQTVTEAAVGMSESIAFSMLVVLFSVLFGRLIWIFGRSLKLIVRRTPLSALDSAGGALIGFVTGVAFVCILLIVLQWLFPITYTSLGYLSPERVKHTLLLKQLVDVLPIAI